MAEREPKSRSVQANHRLLAISGLLGGLVGLTLAVAALQGHRQGDDIGAVMMTGPLPPWLAILLVILLGVVLPFISWRWERVVDEHERQAYRDGAVAGFYLFSLGVPIWWLLWRGGLAPPIDAIALYPAFLFVTGVVWLWRKYR